MKTKVTKDPRKDPRNATFAQWRRALATLPMRDLRQVAADADRWFEMDPEDCVDVSVAT